jgi:hypothetical protein
VKSADDNLDPQLMQAPAPAAENVPARQLEQAAALVWPGSAENVPAGQIEQAATLVCPGSPENVPAAQGMQIVAPAAEYVPAGQLEQAAALVWPGSAENVPAGQIEQAATLVCPGSPENVPAAQGMQIVAPAAEYVPAGQLEQAAALVWPGIADKVPAGHEVQTKAAAAEYVPAAQGMHKVDSQPIILHSATKPLNVTEKSVVRVTRRNPVVDLYVLPCGSTKPECLRICVCGTHEAELHSKICTQSNPDSVLNALNEI